MTNKIRRTTLRSICLAIALLMFMMTMGCNNVEEMPTNTTAGQTVENTTAGKSTAVTEEKNPYTPGSCDIEPLTEAECAILANSINSTALVDPVKIASDFDIIYEPEVTDDGGWYYSHMANIFSFNGKIVVMWANGKRNEMDKGQRVLYMYSEDGGESWSTPVALYNSETYTNPDICFSTGGFAVYNGTLYAYSSAHTVVKEPQSKTVPSITSFEGLYYRTSKDGINWSGMRKSSTGASCMAKPLRSGRLMNYWYDSTYISYTDKISPMTGQGVGWSTSSIDLNEAKFRNGNNSFIERDFYQNDDGVVFMYYRSNWSQSRKLWVSFSFDEGETWSRLYPTNFKDGISKPAIGRLPDGRYYIINNPEFDNDYTRNPLVLSISEDGVNFSKQYILRNESNVYTQKEFGWQKLGDFAYPSVLIDGDYMYVIHSVKNECIGITKVALADI